MTWKDRLQDASFRGVPFKVEEESAGTGRRVETHEYPNRDKPYTEDLGKVTFRPSITAYVVGDDCFDQRDRLIEALNKPGPGTLVHPTYGELKVCVDGEVRVSTSKSEGRIVRFDLKFVEAGELSYPTSGAATAQTLMSSCSALDDCISDSFSGFSIDGVADFVQNDVIGKPRRRISSARVRTVLPVVTPRQARLPPIWMMTTLTCCRRSFAAWWRHPVPAWRRGGTTSCLPRFVRCC